MIDGMDTVIIGGGQAGLAMSQCLLESGIGRERQVILERGQIGERWRSSYWDSLHLLTPNWQTRLPAGNHRHACQQEEHGFMTKAEFVSYLQYYASSFQAPILTHTKVLEVKECQDCDGTPDYRFQVTAMNDQREKKVWLTRNVVIATGYCDLPRVPVFANSLPPQVVRQIAASKYTNPRQVLSWFRPDTNNTILIVGAGASGMQIASELAQAVHSNPHSSTIRIVVSVGRHCRCPRTYRGKDILWWMDQMGAFRATANQLEESNSPGPQLSGSPGQNDVSLHHLHKHYGVEIVGKLQPPNLDGTLEFDNAMLGRHLQQADDACMQMFQAIDNFIDQQNLNPTNSPHLSLPLQQHHDEKIICPRLPYNQLSAGQSRIKLAQSARICILWATGFTRQYPFLDERIMSKLWDAERCVLRNEGGITPQPGLYVLGYRWLRRKHSNFVHGVGEDAMELAQHMASSRKT
jgi:putative flavoprotein involved in K+ transport